MTAIGGHWGQSLLSKPPIKMGNATRLQAREDVICGTIAAKREKAVFMRASPSSLCRVYTQRTVMQQNDVWNRGCGTDHGGLRTTQVVRWHN